MRLKNIGAVLAGAALIGGLAVPAASASTATAHRPFSTIYDISDHDDGNYITFNGHNEAALLESLGATNSFILQDCAKKYAQRGGWETYCLYNQGGECLNAADGIIFFDSCVEQSSEYIWHDGNWLISLFYSQGSYAGQNGALDAEIGGSPEGISIEEIPEDGGSMPSNQWTFTVD